MLGFSSITDSKQFITHSIPPACQQGHKFICVGKFTNAQDKPINCSQLSECAIIMQAANTTEYWTCLCVEEGSLSRTFDSGHSYAQEEYATKRALKVTALRHL